jgi:hypothetical protein
MPDCSALARVRDRLLPALLVAALLVLLQLRSGVETGILTVALMAVFAYVALAGGRLLAGAAGVNGGDPSTAWVLGLLALCLAIFGLTIVLPVTAGGAFGLMATAIIALEFAFRRKLPGFDLKASTGFALAVLLTAAWCYEPARAYEVVRTQGFLPLWSDYFFQGGLISQFGDPRALGRGSIYLADYPSSFYHFASYGAAAAFARILDQPGLPLAAAAWLPLGFLAMLAGGYALGTRLAGPAGGMAALAALALLPDASNYGLRNGWFSFHWTLFATAGATYALGGAFLSLALLGGSRRALAGSALLALSTLVFRAHVFVLLLPAWLAAAAVCHLPGPRRRIAWLMLGLLVISAGAASLFIGALAETGFWRIRAGSALVDFLLYVHTDQEPTAYTGVYERLRLLDQPALQLSAGVGLAFVAALGAFVLALPAAALVAHRRHVLQPLDAACGYLLVAWLLLMLFAPTPWHGDPSDLIHRPFVLLYAACTIWTLCLLVRVFDRQAWRVLFVIMLVALPVVFATASQMAKPKFRWSELDAAVRVPPGLAEAARFMRRNSAPGETFAAAGLKLAYQTFDLSTQVVALSGLPAYLSRPHFEMIKDAPRREIATRRLAALQELEDTVQYEAAMHALRELNVRWYVVAEAEGPRWDPARARAAFKSGTVALYRTP